MKIGNDLPNVCFHLSVSLLLQKLFLLPSEEIQIGRNGRTEILPTFSEGGLGSLALEMA